MVMFGAGRASSDVRGRRQEAVRDLRMSKLVSAARCRSTRDECASSDGWRAAQRRTVSRTNISRDEGGGGRGRGGG